jgi:hypothetical protein
MVHIALQSKDKRRGLISFFAFLRIWCPTHTGEWHCAAASAVTLLNSSQLQAIFKIQSIATWHFAEERWSRSMGKRTKICVNICLVNQNNYYDCCEDACQQIFTEM